MIHALVIDDNRQMADVLVEMLRLLDIEARTAYGASAGMSILNSWVPELVLLDINMPGVDGFEILGFLRREPRLTHVPVVVVTSDDQPETRKRVMSMGAKGMVIKPPTLDRLESTMREAGIIP